MEKSISTILTVDDEEINIEILNTLLGDDYYILSASNGQSAIEIAQEGGIDLILLDIVMPNMNGLEVCKVLKSNKNTKDIPIIFITSKTDEDIIEKAYDIGGDDYVIKPFREKELIARVNLNLKLSKTLKSLEFMANKDFMTSLYNRRKFFELGYEIFEKKDNIFAAMLDIDNFRNVNNSFGHPFGDIVIREVAKTISKNIDKNSILGRLGGEEFAIIYQLDSIEEVKENIEKIRRSIENLEFNFDCKDLKVTISSGISEKCSNDCIDSLLKRADEGLYISKERGKNRSSFRGCEFYE